MPTFRLFKQMESGDRVCFIIRKRSVVSAELYYHKIEKRWQVNKTRRGGINEEMVQLRLENVQAPWELFDNFLFKRATVDGDEIVAINS